MNYFFAIVLPPVGVLMTGKKLQALLNLILTLILWLPGVIHALLVVNNYNEERRLEELSRKIEKGLNEVIR